MKQKRSRFGLLKLSLKALSLILALGMTVYVMYLLNSNHSDDLFSSLGLGDGQRLNWCSSRLTRLEGLGAENQWTLFEADNKWFVEKKNQPAMAVNYLAVEKWLAKYCSLKIKVFKSEKVLDMKIKPFARAQFVDKSKARIYLVENKYYQINEVVFSSKQFAQALDEFGKTISIPTGKL